jgi:hypothetical protein
MPIMHLVASVTVISQPLMATGTGALQNWRFTQPRIFAP